MTDRGREREELEESEEAIQKELEREEEEGRRREERRRGKEGDKEVSYRMKRREETG